MNKLFTDNLPWKIAALLIATILWIFVINTQNPTQPQEIAGVSIQIKGEEELNNQGYELSNRQEILNQNFKIVVSGPRLEVDKLVRDPSLIMVTLNLTEYTSDLTQDSILDNATYTVKINLDGGSVIVKDKRPQVNKIRIDKIESKEQKITYQISEDILNHYTLIGDGIPVISPEKIEITGPKSEIDRVAEAKVYIEAKDFSEEHLVSTLPIKLYDIDGEEITGLELSPEVAEVKLPIGSQKVVPIKINYKGELTEGYVLTKVNASLTETTIIGKAEALSQIQEIQLEPIDLSTLKEADLVQVKVKMILPEGVVTLGEDVVSVNLQVEAEKTLSYSIQIDELNLTVTGIREDLNFEILTPSIEVELSGLSDDLVAIDKLDIEATLDLSQYTEGEYTLPLTIIVPDHIKVNNSPEVKVSITKLSMDSPTPTPEEDIVSDDETTDIVEEESKEDTEQEEVATQ